MEVHFDPLEHTLAEYRGIGTIIVVLSRTASHDTEGTVGCAGKGFDLHFKQTSKLLGRFAEVKTATSGDLYMELTHFSKGGYCGFVEIHAREQHPRR